MAAGGLHAGVKLRHIRAFLGIAEAGNLSAVARGQGISQPALSRTLAELEELLGRPLFRREGGRLVLTEAGALFRRHSRAALAELEAGAAILRPGGGGRLRAGVLPTVAARLFPQVAIRFHGVMPDVVLAVETGPHFHLMRQLREGGIDVMVGRLPGASEMEGLTFDHLYEEEVALIARAEHPLRGRPAAEALAQAPLILPPATAIIRRSVDDYLAALGLGPVRPAWETASLAVGRGIVMRSDALWFISRGVVAEELERGGLIALPVAARFLSGAVGICRRHGHAAPGLEVLAQIAREAAAEIAD